MDRKVVKRIAALALCISFFLPLSQCSRMEGNLSPSAVPIVIAAFSAYDWPSIGSSIAVVCFFWPAFVQLLSLFKEDALGGRWGWTVELVMCVLTAAGITWLILWGETVRFGALIAYAAVAAYAAALLRKRSLGTPNLKFDTDATRRST